MIYPRQPIFSLLVAWKIVLSLVLCLRQPAGQDQETICGTLCNATVDAAKHYPKNGSGAFNDTFAAQLVGWDKETTERTNITCGICNLLALRDLSKRLQETSAVYSSSLLQQNVQDACTWLYGAADPDRNCEDSLRFFCFWNWMDPFELLNILDDTCEANDTVRCLL